MAIVALLAGGFGLFCCFAAVVLSIIGFMGIFGLISALSAIVFGHLALHRVKRTGEPGRGMSIGGLVMGYIGTVAWVGMLIIIIVLVSRHSGA
ncbi:DUF4190 domain-containing protein [Actinomadura logoneensis]|nr:DUF4190 domain-containing protein [Actinomadura logoneensis]